MKKITFTLFLFCAINFSFAQFFQGIGIFAGGMASRHKYNDSNSPITLGSHKGKFIFRLCGGIIGDFLPNENIKWRSEVEYNMKGSRESVSGSDGENQILKNKLDYISWNNFLKIQTETNFGFLYLLIGPRVEYLFRANTTAYTSAMNNLPKLHFSWSAGIGFEFIAYGPIKFFTEYHINPDILPLYKKANVKIKNITQEFRVGLMYKIIKKKESCNSPIFSGSEQ